MAGRFEGFKIWSGSCLKTYCPREKEGGMPFRIIKYQLYVLITGCRWCGYTSTGTMGIKKFCPSMHKRWYEDGTLEKTVWAWILGGGRGESEMIDWKYGAVDGPFLVKVAVEDAQLCIIGKGHSNIYRCQRYASSGNSSPRQYDERQQVPSMLVQPAGNGKKRGNRRTSLKNSCC